MTVEHLVKNDSVNISDDEWFKEMRKRRQTEWNEIIVEGVKLEYQKKYIKEVK